MNILVTGGTGLIAKTLIPRLQEKGHQVRILSRKKKSGYFYWDLQKRTIDEKAFENLDVIIHLAGETIAQKWTKQAKKQILSSRIDSANLLFDYAKTFAPNLSVFISASGANFYGTKTINKEFVETDEPGTDFLAQVCVKWENAAQKFSQLNTRIVCLRTGVVLARQGGIIQKIMTPAKLFLHSPLGSGNQIIPWIHLSDLCDFYVKATEDKNILGPFNAVSSHVVSNAEFTKTFNKQIKRNTLLPNIPSFVLKMIFGEMANILLKGSALSTKKNQLNGIKFKFQNLNTAFSNLLKD